MIKLLTYCSIFSPMIPIVIGVHRRTHVIWILCVVSILMELLNYLFAKFHLDIFLINNIFSLVEFSFLTFYYYINLKEKWIGAVLILGIILFGTKAQDVLQKINNQGIFFLHVLLIIYSIIGFVKILRRVPPNNPLHTGFFWINSAVLLFNSTTSAVVLFAEYLRQHDPALLALAWPVIYCLLNIVFFALTAVGLTRKTQTL